MKSLVVRTNHWKNRKAIFSFVTSAEYINLINFMHIRNLEIYNYITETKWRIMFSKNALLQYNFLKYMFFHNSINIFLIIFNTSCTKYFELWSTESVFHLLLYKFAKLLN